MKIITDIQTCQQFSLSQKTKNKSIALVPTMGGLHAGHLSLIKEANKQCDVVIVTIFLNPLQFDNNEDLDCYPADFKNDINLCKKNDVDIIFAPTNAMMYNSSASTFVNENKLSQGLCGSSRIGHFDGVATVVTKLYNITLPDKAFFGQKDYQQLCVIRQLTHDLNFPIKVIAIPTYRQNDGLAFSTRNQYLTVKERQKAPIIFQLLNETKKAIINGSINSEDTIISISERLCKLGAKIDYIQICHHQTLEPLSGNLEANIGQLFIAIFFNKTRLIDNIFLGS